MSAEVRPARDAGEREAALALRLAVFCEEQGVAPEEELDGRDGEALHLVAVERGRVIGTCRLLTEGDTAKLGRMAVARDARRRGVGRLLLAAAEAHARDAGSGRVALAAQTGARPLYASAGYVARGGPFIDAGIVHVMMEKRLA